MTGIKKKNLQRQKGNSNGEYERDLHSIKELMIKLSSEEIVDCSHIYVSTWSISVV